jgi:hypothetical protein
MWCRSVAVGATAAVTGEERPVGNARTFPSGDGACHPITGPSIRVANTHNDGRCGGATATLRFQWGVFASRDGFR